ncbi:MAG: 2-dehydropantoate 2-reductase [Nitrospinae bacterium]|nr:2-dehydropantoate 2-reductase [Nitrospinota bacterium]
MEILIIGAGAVGGYFGGLLAKGRDNSAGSLDVTFLARGEHLKAIQERGLSIKSIKGDFNIRVRAVERLPDAEKFDLIIFAVKSYDLPDACQNIKNAVGDNTIIMSLLNGVDSEDIVGSFFGMEKVIGSVAFIGAQILEPGVISHTAAGMITIGELNNPINPPLIPLYKRGTEGDLRGTGGRCEEILRIFESAGVPIKLSEDINKDIWSKMVWNVGFNAITAITGSMVSDVLAVPESRKVVEMAMKETVDVAREKGIKITDDIVEKTISKTLKAGAIKTSMLQDIENGKKTEIDSINGAIVRMGREMGIPVPVNETLYGIVKIIDKG